MISFRQTFVLCLLLVPCAYGQELRFNGKVTETSCRMDFSLRGMTLDLGDISTDEARYAKGFTTPQKPFVVRLTDCPPDYPFISLTFQGEADGKDDRLLALEQPSASSLKGAGVVFYDMNVHSTPAPVMPVNTGRSARVKTDKQGNAELYFSAAIMTNGELPSPGVSQPVVSVTLNYE